MKKLASVGIALVVLVFVPILGACSSSPGGSASPSASPSQGGGGTLAALAASQVTVSNAGSPQVAMAFPFPSQASTLTTEDVREGSGSVVASSSRVTVNYVGMGATTGKAFDSSYTRGEPATFSLGGVIQGWQQGMLGMKNGGERVLVIPASLGYGTRPPPGSGILADETLVFYVQLVAVDG